MAEVERAALMEMAPTPGSTRVRSRRRGITIFILVCAGNVALLVLLITQLLTPAQSQRSQASSHLVAGSPVSSGDFASPLIGKPAPDFTLSVLSTGSAPGSGAQPSLNLAAYKGKPVILNFWASWCTPCNDEAAFLQRSWLSLKARGIVLIGIDGPEKRDAALKFMQQYKITYPNVQDTFASATAIDYNVAGLPATIFIDRHGTIVAHWISPLNAQGLQHEMDRLTR